MVVRQHQQLFVYGSLKRGGSNHPWLEGARWLGRARLAGHRLHNLGDYPMAVPGRGVVHGEVYGVDGAALARLDRLEDVPDEYRRRRCRLDDGRRCWVYLGSPSQVRQAPRVPYDDWQSTPVFCYGSDLDPLWLRRRCPDWDGSAWVARLPDWRWQAAAGPLLECGVAALIRPAPGAHCWGVVIHERGVAASRRRQSVAAGAAGWRLVGLRLEPWQHGALRTPVGALARVWWPERCQGSPALERNGERLAGAPRPSRRRLLAGAVQHGLPARWREQLERDLPAGP